MSNRIANFLIDGNFYDVANYYDETIYCGEPYWLTVPCANHTVKHYYLCRFTKDWDYPMALSAHVFGWGWEGVCYFPEHTAQELLSELVAIAMGSSLEGCFKVCKRYINTRRVLVGSDHISVQTLMEKASGENSRASRLSG